MANRSKARVTDVAICACTAHAPRCAPANNALQVACVRAFHAARPRTSRAQRAGRGGRAGTRSDRVRPIRQDARGMRLLHTSDWHLGHTLRGEVAREYEHAAFLTWLLQACVREAADALVITGDVFDSATPPASAERMWFEFLAAARRARPAMDIIAIAGNHDSPARLGAASAVLRELGVHVIGGLPRIPPGPQSIAFGDAATSQRGPFGPVAGESARVPPGPQPSAAVAFGDAAASQRGPFGPVAGESARVPPGPQPSAAVAFGDAAASQRGP